MNAATSYQRLVLPTHATGLCVHWPCPSSGQSHMQKEQCKDCCNELPRLVQIVFGVSETHGGHYSFPTIRLRGCSLVHPAKDEPLVRDIEQQPVSFAPRPPEYCSRHLYGCDDEKASIIHK